MRRNEIGGEGWKGVKGEENVKEERKTWKLGRVDGGARKCMGVEAAALGPEIAVI